MANGSSGSCTIQTCRETDGRWIAELPILPGALAYGATKAEAIRACQRLVHQILRADGRDLDFINPAWNMTLKVKPGG